MTYGRIVALIVFGTLPYITAWNEKYADEGLLIIGIHSPENLNLKRPIQC